MPTFSLDEILQAAFEAFYASLAAPTGGWFAKERDCLNRFVMSCLVPACTPGSVLHHPAQIGIESAVKQPTGIGQRRTSPADIAIWSRPHGNCWSPAMLPVVAALAVLRRLTVARCERGAWGDEWLVRPSRKT